MSLQSYIENLRARPEHIRRRYSFWISFGVTAVVFVFWLASLTAIDDSINDAAVRAVDKAGAPAQSMVAAVGSFFGDIKDIVFGPKKITYSSVEVSPGKR